MAAVVNRRAGARAVLAAGALLLGPILLAGPAYADTASSTPIATEPPAAATCLPDTAASCAQDQGVSPVPATATTRATASVTSAPTPTPTATPTTVTATPTTATAAPVVTTLPSTGAPATLAHTGAGSAGGWGYAGTALLLGGSVLVLAARRPRAAAQR
jgi:hypothetical protein